MDKMRGNEMRETIMICLEQLGIGGIETVVVNQTAIFIQKGFRVVILASPGIYTKRLKELGAICISFNFCLENQFNINKIEKICNILQEYQITQIHIHQFPCILSVFPAAIISNIPYLAYLHISSELLEQTYCWYLSTYSIYEKAFPWYFENAYKIIAITQSNADYNAQKFGIEKGKYKVLFNSINLLLYQGDINKNNKSKFLLISRLSKEKEESVKTGIDLFVAYYHSQAKQKSELTILGSGDYQEKIQEYINSNYYEETAAITFFGENNDIASIEKEYDVVLGLGRCILEAVAMKKIAIIVEDKKAVMVEPNTIRELSESNFSQAEKETVAVIEKLTQLSQQQILEMVEKNYHYVKEYLNLEKNIFYLQSEENSYPKKFIFELFKQVIEKTEKVIQLEQVEKQLGKRLQKQGESEILIKQTQEECLQLKKELFAIYSSKRWKYSTKIVKLFKKGK